MSMSKFKAIFAWAVLNVVLFFVVMVNGFHASPSLVIATMLMQTLYGAGVAFVQRGGAQK